jgi:hypothetical protein
MLLIMRMINNEEKHVLVPDCVTKSYSLQLLCMRIIIKNERKNGLGPDCVTKTYSLQLFNTNTTK